MCVFFNLPSKVENSVIFTSQVVHFVFQLHVLPPYLAPFQLLIVFSFGSSFYTKSSTCIFTLLTNIDSFFLPHKFYIKPSTCVTTPSPHPASPPPPVKYWYFISFHTSSTLSLSTLCYSHLHILLVDNVCPSTHVIVISLGKIYKILVDIYCLDIWHLYRDSTQHKFLSFFLMESSQFCQKKTLYTYLYF